MEEAAPLLGAFEIDADRAEPLHRQLYDSLRRSILEGRLATGVRLPATRKLADDLGVSRNTVLAAFEQLAAEGYLESRVGSGTRVARLSPEALLQVAPTRRAKSERVDEGPIAELSRRGRELAGIRRPVTSPGLAFQPGMPAIPEFPFGLWARLLSRRARQVRSESLGYRHNSGFPPLKRAIASYLSAARGVRCEPEQVVVVCGAQAGLDVASRMLVDPGDPVWIENPGYLGARGALTAAGAQLVPMAVDEEGLDVAAAEERRPDARLAYVTPSRQFPLGHTMSLPRRLALIEWAARRNAWILEDDYESEYRYTGRPLAALQGLDRRERVVYVGTFSKTMFPAMRVGYLIVPGRLVDAFATALRNTGHAAPVPVQAALADFLLDGHFGSHVRRMRGLYAERGQRLAELLRSELDGALRVPDATAGIQLSCPLDLPLDDAEISRRAADLGVHATAFSQYTIGEPEKRGFYLGFAAIPPDEMRDPVERLARAIASVRDDARRDASTRRAPRSRSRRIDASKAS
jgi:GntR family transcriptional regulator / MocR family aminotransferase